MILFLMLDVFRVKIWINIRKPPMHGVTISGENGGRIDGDR